MPQLNLKRRQTLFGIVSAVFLVISVMAIAYSTSSQVQLFASQAKEKVDRQTRLIQERAKNFQNYVDSQIRQRERAGQSGAGPVCQGAWCLGPELIANQNDPANQTGLAKEIIDTYNAAVNNNDQAALDKLKANSETLYNQAQAAIAQKQATQQQNQVQQLTNDCNNDNTRGQFICTTPSGLQEYANFRIAEARQLLARIEIAPPGTYTNAQIDQYLTTLAHYVDEKVITRSDFDTAANLVASSRALTKATPAITATTAPATVKPAATIKPTLPPSTQPPASAQAVQTAKPLATINAVGTAVGIPVAPQTQPSLLSQIVSAISKIIPIQNIFGTQPGTSPAPTEPEKITIPSAEPATTIKTEAKSGGGGTAPTQPTSLVSRFVDFLSRISPVPIPTGIDIQKFLSTPITLPNIFGSPPTVSSSPLPSGQAATIPVAPGAPAIPPNASNLERLNNIPAYDLTKPSKTALYGGNQMEQLYELYKSQTDSWWYKQTNGNFTKADFLALMIIAEASNRDLKVIQAQMDASRNILWNSNDPYTLAQIGKDRYCYTTDCQGGGGLFNWMANLEVSRRRYNAYVLNPGENSITNLANDSTFADYFAQKGYTLHEIANYILKDPNPTTWDPNVPSGWGNGEGWMYRAAKSGNIGTTDYNGIYYASGGDFIYTDAQRAYWESGIVPKSSPSGPAPAPLENSIPPTSSNGTKSNGIPVTTTKVGVGQSEPSQPNIFVQTVNNVATTTKNIILYPIKPIQNAVNNIIDLATGAQTIKTLFYGGLVPQSGNTTAPVTGTFPNSNPQTTTQQGAVQAPSARTLDQTSKLENFSIFLQYGTGESQRINNYGGTLLKWGCGPSTAYNILRYEGYNVTFQQVLDSYLWNSVGSDGPSVLLDLRRNGFPVDTVDYGIKNIITDAKQLANYNGLLVYSGKVGSVDHIAAFSCDQGTCYSIDSYFSTGKPVKCDIESTVRLNCGGVKYKVGESSGVPYAFYPVKQP